MHCSWVVLSYLLLYYRRHLPHSEIDTFKLPDSILNNFRIVLVLHTILWRIYIISYCIPSGSFTNRLPKRRIWAFLFLPPVGSRILFLQVFEMSWDDATSMRSCDTLRDVYYGLIPGLYGCKTCLLWWQKQEYWGQSSGGIYIYFPQYIFVSLRSLRCMDSFQEYFDKKEACMKGPGISAVLA